jgi:hypothetical protein
MVHENFVKSQKKKENDENVYESSNGDEEVVRKNT